MKQCWVFILLLLFSLAQGACTTNGGIEAGNPDIAGKKLTLVAEGSSATYVVLFNEAPQALITQIIENNYESKNETYTLEGLVLTLQALFSNGDQIEIRITLDNLFEFLEVLLTLNGSIIPTEAEAESGPPVCLREETNAALQITNLLCSRIVQCTQTVLCHECEANVLEVPGLANQLGAPPNTTMAEGAEGIDNGQLEVDEEKLAICLEDTLLIPCNLVLENFGDGANPNYNTVKSLLPKPSCAPGILRENNNP